MTSTSVFCRNKQLFFFSFAFCENGKVFDLVSHTNGTLGPVDIIVNCAGLGYYTTMSNCHLDEWERMVDVNCKVF